MKTIEKTRLEPSDLVVVDGEVYRTDTRIHGKSCAEQCHLVDATGGCRGYCWRWDNADDIVFRHIISARLLSPDACVCVTPMWSAYDKAVREKARKAQNEKSRLYHAAKKEGVERKKKGRKPKGGIEEPCEYLKTYRARIIIDGRTYRRQSPNREELEAWLEEMRKNTEKL